MSDTTSSPTLDKLAFTLSSDGTYYSVKALNTSISGEVVIPAEYEGLPVKEIEDWAFQFCSSLTSIIIPNSVTSIGQWAFESCSALTSIIIPDSVTSIKYCTFSYCTSLTSVIIPDGVTSIGFNAFEYCSSLKSITIPNSVTSIVQGAFSYCLVLTNVIIKGKPIVDLYAFNNTTKLEKIYVIDGQSYVSTDTIDGKPIEILPAEPSVFAKIMSVKSMTIS